MGTVINNHFHNLVINENFIVNAVYGVVEQIDVVGKAVAVSKYDGMFTMLSIKSKDEKIDLKISGEFYGSIGDKVILTYIEDDDKYRKYVSIQNVDSWKLSYMEDEDSIIDYYYKKKSKKTFRLVTMLGISLLCLVVSHFDFSLPVFKQLHSNSHYILSFCIFMILSLFVSFEMKQTKIYYSNLISAKIRSINESISCPILIKKMLC